jgi:hypothetical protein
MQPADAAPQRARSVLVFAVSKRWGVKNVENDLLQRNIIASDGKATRNALRR